MNIGEAQILAYNAEIIAARVRVDGMIAENMQRARQDKALAYAEEAFVKEANYITSCANSILETALRTLSVGHHEYKSQEHFCTQCKKPMGGEWILGPVCGKCCRENQARVTERRQ